MTPSHLVPSLNIQLRNLPAPQCLLSTDALPTPCFPCWLPFSSTPFFCLLLWAALTHSSQAASYPVWLMLCSPLAVLSFPFPANAFPPPFTAWNLLGLAIPSAFPPSCLFPFPPPLAAAHCFPLCFSSQEFLPHAAPYPPLSKMHSLVGWSLSTSFGLSMIWGGCWCFQSISVKCRWFCTSTYK